METHIPLEYVAYIYATCISLVYEFCIRQGELVVRTKHDPIIGKSPSLKPSLLKLMVLSKSLMQCP